MVDETEPSDGPPSAPEPISTQGLAPTLVRIVPDIPVVYADGIVNQVIGPGISSSKSRALVGVHVLSLAFMRSGGMEKVARDCRKTCQEGKRT